MVESIKGAFQVAWPRDLGLEKAFPIRRLNNCPKMFHSRQARKDAKLILTRVAVSHPGQPCTSPNEVLTGSISDHSDYRATAMFANVTRNNDDENVNAFIS